MIDIKLIRENPEMVQEKIRSKGVEVDIAKVVKLDEEHRKLQQQVDEFRSAKNRTTTEISKASPEEKKKLIAEMKKQDTEHDKLAEGFKKVGDELETLLYQIPNLPTDDVKIGADESGNEELRKVGEPTEFKFEPKDHVALGEALNAIDIERGAKVSGSRFGYLKNGAALLEFALLHYAMDRLLGHGFQPVVPPVLIKSDMMRGMGYLEHGGDQEIYHLANDDLVLIGTSEQAIGPMHANEILKTDQLPLRYVGYSPCFRREAGAYGKDTRGMLRVHQFEKVEMFSFTTPEQSEQEHEFFLALEEAMMKDLGLPYRVLKMCTGDLGPQAARKYDIEAWLPSQKTYRETHSTSTCTDFQSRRLKIRHKTKENENQLLHTVNGTVFSGRAIIAILENFQQKDGSVVIPKPLRKWMHGVKKLEPIN
jgi:seryl-tRNA synthetase